MTSAGQFGAGWSRRAKIPITGISASLAEQAIATGGMLQARVRGIGKDGGPFCASVPLLSEWAVVDATEQTWVPPATAWCRPDCQLPVDLTAGGSRVSQGLVMRTW